ncbi:chromo domain-containing protein cec-1-like [Nasonia vitripennis]|uniref:DUF4806 domain-containing protein n=1 Tax=Nasonia vitripennis TaxID=7425 RepID=A0A7M7T661_NASVI|nr:chromo domain-containing protein cec-1-like [Nasonia vitripennis]
MKDTLKQLEEVTSLFDERIEKMGNKVTAIHDILKDLTNANSSAARTRPEFLSFKTTADIVAFDHLGDNEFYALVCYLRYLRGANEIDAAAIYFKSCLKFGDDLFRNLTWHGSKSDNTILALKYTRFALVCSEAMPVIKKIFRKPNETEYSSAMTKALKSAKEANRRQLRRKVSPAEQLLPKRQRQQYPPQNNAACMEEDDADLEAGHQPMDQQQPNDEDRYSDHELFDDTQVIDEEQEEEGGEEENAQGEEEEEQDAQGEEEDVQEEEEDEETQGEEEEGEEQEEEEVGTKQQREESDEDFFP